MKSIIRKFGSFGGEDRLSNYLNYMFEKYGSKGVKSLIYSLGIASKATALILAYNSFKNLQDCYGAATFFSSILWYIVAIYAGRVAYNIK